MNLSPVELSNSLPALPLVGGQISILGGNYSQLSGGQLYTARFLANNASNASATLGGTQLSVRVPSGTTLDPNLPVLVRIQPGNPSPVLEVVGQWMPAPTSGSLTGPTTDLSGFSGSVLRAVIQQASNGQLSINVGGQSIPIQSSELSPGQSIFVRLAASNAATKQLIAETALGNATRAALPGNGISSLVQTSLARAEVVKVLPNGQFQVQVNGKNFSIEADPTLKVGSKFIAQLETTPEGTSLRLAAPEEVSPNEVATAILQDLPQRTSISSTLQNLFQSLSSLANSAGQNGSTPALLQQLQATISKLVGQPGSAPASQQLSQFVRDGGLQYEAKLAQLLTAGSAPAAALQAVATSDLKGQLLDILARTQSADAPGAGHVLPSQPINSDLQATVRAALDQIESQQALNVMAKAQGEPFQLQFPLSVGGTWTTMQLSVHPDDSRDSPTNSRSRGYNLLMHLDLTETGTTWVDARIAGQSIHAVVYVGNASSREQVRENLPALQESLQQLGFSRVQLDVQSVTDRPDGPDAKRFQCARDGNPRVGVTGG